METKENKSLAEKIGEEQCILKGKKNYRRSGSSGGAFKYNLLVKSSKFYWKEWPTPKKGIVFKMFSPQFIIFAKCLPKFI